MAGRVTAGYRFMAEQEGLTLASMTQMSLNSVRSGIFNVTRLVIKMAE